MFASKDVFLTPPSGGYTISRSVRLRSSASGNFSRTPASAGNRKTWTWSAWIKRGTLGVNQALFNAGTGTTDATWSGIWFDGGNALEIGGYTNTWRVTSQVFRDPSAWYHIVVVMDTTQATATDRVKLYVNGSQVTSFSSTVNPTQNTDLGINQSAIHDIGYQTTSVSLGYFDGYMTEINFIDGQALTPSSFGSTNALTGVWQPAKYTGTYGTNGFYLNFSDNSAATPATLGKDSSGATSNVIVGSSTNASTTLTVVSISGISVGNIVNGPGIPSNTYVTAIGVLQVTLSQAATSTNASQNYTFSGNNWTPNNISVTAGTTYDSMVDSPTVSVTSSNYCVMNPLVTPTSGSLSNGNLNSSQTYQGFQSSFAMSSGQWYWEITGLTNTASNNMRIGIAPQGYTVGTSTPGDLTGSYAYAANGQKGSGGSYASYGASFTDNDVIGVAFDATNGTLAFYKNGTSQGTAYTGISGTFFALTGSGSSSTMTMCANFGQRPFTYTPPTGFVALNTYNLPASTITNGAAYMAATLYTGNGSTQSISNAVNGVSFQPDLVWGKSRSAATSHLLVDSVRGTGVYLLTNSTAAEGSASNTVTSFNSGGFSLGADTTLNTNASTYVGWQWKAGGSSSSNTNGSITSTVSVGATQGFSVVTYTGNGSSSATVGHGLGVTPSMIICKSRSDVVGWFVYHSSLSAGNYIALNNTNATQVTSSSVNGAISTSPTSSVFGFTSGTSGVSNVNTNSSTYVAYCFAAVKGFSAFGSYTGNGSNDGPFVYLGFRPRFLLIKNTTTAGTDWEIWDSARDLSNVETNRLYPDSSAAENGGQNAYDFLANGFKARQGGATDSNQSGATIIYAAFAENPTKYALAR